ncbi:MAG: hypothetical protein ABSB71_07855 [Candidatus Bathyarchaeia archaeon]|jgi:hypothetical protein
MNRLKIYRLLLWAAVEYLAGYEFPVWSKGEWKTGGQWKLDPFLPSELNNKKVE